MKISIIGGNGFLGSRIASELCTKYNILLVDQHKFSGNLINAQYIESDFNEKCVYEALEGFDIVYFCGGHTDISKTWDNPILEVENTILPQFLFFKKLSEIGVKKIVFPSSGGTIYGSESYYSCENSLPHPCIPYAISKMTIEYFLEYLRCKSNINYDIYRIANIYGDQSNKSQKQGVISVWIDCLSHKKKVILYGKSEKRDYVYVDDAAHLMTYSVENIFSSNVFNIGTGVGTSLCDLVSIFKEIIGYDFPFEIKEKRIFDSECSVLDSSKILSHFPEFCFSNLKEKIKYLWEKRIIE